MSKLHDHATALLRCLPPETAHNLTLKGLARGFGPRVRADRHPSLRTRLWGLDFPNPIGIAAGFDKNAVAVSGALNLGVGFIEVGGVTPRPQPGNPRPRLFRLPEDQALINRMGFNNEGVEAVAARLDQGPRPGIVGVNMAANTDSRDPIADFVQLTTTFARRADFLTADVSCPNTRNGQVFLEPGALSELVDAIIRARDAIGNKPPLLVKLSPDIDDRRLQELLRVIIAADIAGLIICNTTRSRPASLRGRHRHESGGLSGQPLGPAALDMLRRAYSQTKGRLPIVAVGGIASTDDAYGRIKAGANLLQIYTGLVYGGPSLVPGIANGLTQRLHADGFGSLSEAVGTDSV